MARRLKGATRRWFDALPAVTAEIACGGERHSITWRRGKLVLEDHDVLAERSLTALGAEPPLCVEVLDAWRGRRGTELLRELLLRDSTLSPEEVVLQKASYEAEIETTQATVQALRTQMGGHGPPLPQVLKRVEVETDLRIARTKRRWARALMTALPRDLRRVLALSVVVNVERHWHDEDFRREHAEPVESAFGAIALPLLEQSARRWRRNIKPQARFLAESWLVAPGEEPTCAAWAHSGGAYAALSLPISWFTDVWAPGIALVDGCFVLGVSDGSADGTTLNVRALRWERQDREVSKSVGAPAVVRRVRGGNWRLEWRE